MVAHSIGDDIPFNLRSAVYTGLFSTTMISPQQPPYSCPTGNCTWDPFPTLGVSVQCFDDAASYFLNCSKQDSSSWPGHKYSSCNMAGLNIQQIYPPSSSMVYESRGSFMPISPRSHFAPYNSSNFDHGFSGEPKDIDTSMNAGFAMFSWNLARNLFIFDAGMARSSIITSESIIEAGYCIFYINMQIIRARVWHGIYEEHTIDSTTRIRPYRNTKNTSIPSGYSKHYIGLDEVNNLVYTYQPTCENSVATGECEPKEDLKPIDITIPRDRYLNVVAAIGKVLPSANVTTARQNGLHGSGYSNPEAAESLYRSPNITATMHTVAHYVSIALRANDTMLAQQNAATNSTEFLSNYIAPSQRVNGTVYDQAILLQVRWGWLAFPAGLLVMTIGVLFQTIQTSHSEPVGVWKNNPLAVLLNTQWTPEPGMSGAATSAELDKLAKALEVSVVRGDEDGMPERSVMIRRRVPT